MVHFKPGIERRPPTMWSRKVIYSARMSATHCCELFNAATAAFCTLDVGFDVDWLCSFCTAPTTAAGGRGFSRLHPVMAVVLRNATTTRKRPRGVFYSSPQKFFPPQHR